MTEQIQHTSFESQGNALSVDFWILCAFSLMCVFLYVVVWPIISKILTEQRRALKQTFAGLAARRAEAERKKMITIEQKHAANATIKSCEEETHQMIDAMRITHAQQRNAWKKHMILSMSRTVDGETRTRAQAQANALIDGIIQEFSQNSDAMTVFRRNYTRAIITESQPLAPTTDQKNDGCVKK